MDLTDSWVYLSDSWLDKMSTWSVLNSSWEIIELSESFVSERSSSSRCLPNSPGKYEQDVILRWFELLSQWQHDIGRSFLVS